MSDAPEEVPEIVIVDRRIEPLELSRRLHWFDDMIIQERVREITFALIGEGEPLP